MTDNTRLAALETVAEAARVLAYRVKHGLPLLDARCKVQATLDALPADPARGKVVEVRAHVYLDLADGGFVIHEAGYEVSPRYRRHVATLTARVLLPTVPTITADVEVTP